LEGQDPSSYRSFRGRSPSTRKPKSCSSSISSLIDNEFLLDGRTTDEVKTSLKEVDNEWVLYNLLRNLMI
jgi:hypothetical protein